MAPGDGNWANNRPDQITDWNQWNNWRNDNRTGINNNWNNNWHNNWHNCNNWFDGNWWNNNPNIGLALSKQLQLLGLGHVAGA